MLKKSIWFLLLALVSACSTFDEDFLDRKLKAVYKNGELASEYFYNKDEKIVKVIHYKKIEGIPSQENFVIHYSYSNDSVYCNYYNLDESVLKYTRIYSKVSELKYKIDYINYLNEKYNNYNYIYYEHPQFGYSKQEKYRLDGTMYAMFVAEYIDSNGSVRWTSYNYKEGESTDNNPTTSYDYRDSKSFVYSSTYLYPEFERQKGNKTKRGHNGYIDTVIEYEYNGSYPVSAIETYTPYKYNSQGEFEPMEDIITNIKYEYY
ncbi:hypothetical protein [Flammeovirga kamogawensis]|uniref:DUF4595 domain-containing protein n=1 Tax=Flammeovirga kamogawensis TaxID=373891 RepID=A0ABX8H489_9BACT|nr:hypothetical protein [Flammeovirga kamogawensis]MBB6463148.1 hypothetical protein [Flammeovirga kamogawensis]QWG10382.1 hypothetical protein KM029_25745 [Flammeovirga kamogawensis]TRX63892.1 hypothetical protein EO216_26120 [Flammeovirga kamogawensis]